MSRVNRTEAKGSALTRLGAESIWLAAAFALLNVPFWMLSHTNFLSRAWFNVDLLIPLVIVSYSPLGAIVCLVLLWALDLAVSQSLAWHFHSPFEFIRSVEFLPSVHVNSYLSLSWLASLIPFIVCGAAAVALVRWRQRSGRPARTGAAACLVLLCVALVDICNGSTFLWERTERLLPGNVGGSAVKQVATSMLPSSSEKLQSLAPRASLTSQFDVEGWAAKHPDRGVMVVLVESMGLHEDPRMRQWLRAQLVDDRTGAGFDVVDAVVPFRGSTTSGELRELCGLTGSYRELLSTDPAPCLPRRLSLAGWQTVGVHGFSHRMFLRGTWWPKLGLDRQLFAEDLSVPGEKLCGGAFVGICDADVLGRAFKELRGGRRFVYALTLNSHLPLGSVAVPPDLSALCGQIDAGDGVCGLTSVLGIALRAIRTGVEASDLKPLVLVVGDHAPPFSELAWRNEYDQHSVQGFVIVPKE